MLDAFGGEFIFLSWTARAVEVLDYKLELTGRALTAAIEIIGYFVVSGGDVGVS